MMCLSDAVHVVVGITPLLFQGIRENICAEEFHMLLMVALTLML